MIWAAESASKGSAGAPTVATNEGGWSDGGCLNRWPMGG